MNNEKAFAKIEKAASKKKSKTIIGLMEKADKEVLIKALEALGEIGDEASCNQVTHYLENTVDEVRIAACKAGIRIDTEYMKTLIQHQLSLEQNDFVKKEIQKAFYAAKK